MWDDVPGTKAVVENRVSRHLTAVAADDGTMVRSEALAALVFTRAILLDSPQLNAIR